MSNVDPSTSPGEYPRNTSLAGRRCQMFPALEDRLIGRITAHGSERTFAAGALVWEAGDASVPFYVVLDGQLEVVHPYGATETPVTIHKRGEFTGEMALLLGRRTLVRARAKTELRVIVVE